MPLWKPAGEIADDEDDDDAEEDDADDDKGSNIRTWVGSISSGTSSTCSDSGFFINAFGDEPSDIIPDPSTDEFKSEDASFRFFIGFESSSPES